MCEKTDRNVFLLGAGFSRPAGAPLIYDFLERSREFMNNRPQGLDEFGIEQFRKVFEFKREVAKAREKIKIDLDNLEELFGLIEMSFRLGAAGKDTRDSMVYTIAKTLELCVLSPERRSRFGVPVPTERASEFDFLCRREYERIGNSEPKQYFVEMYEFFALLLGGAFDPPSQRKFRKNVVITFNYDLVLDNALQRVGYQPWYGHDLGEDTTDKISLLKLHGSANWAVCGVCGKPYVLHEKLTQSIEAFNSLACTCGSRTLEPLLVPPSWDKNGHRDTLQPVWQAAVHELKSATRICVIGYSLPDSDSFFRYLVTLALSENHQLEKFIVVDQVGQSASTRTKKKTVEEKWTELLDGVFRERRFKFYGNGVEQFLSECSAHKELNRADNLGDRVSSYGPPMRREVTSSA